MGSILKEQSQSEDIKHSEEKEYKQLCYKLFQLQDYKVKAPNGDFRCPFCASNDEPYYGYARLLQHAIRVAEGSISVRQRVKHSAMAGYLAVDLGSEVNAEEDGRSSDVDWVAPSCRKRSRSGSTSKINSGRKPLGARATVNAQKVAMAEKREKEAVDQVKELERKMNEMRNETNAVITRERNELQRVRTELLKEKALSTIYKANGGQKCDDIIGVKKIGKLDAEVFKRAYKKRFPAVEEAVAEARGVELCSTWQEKLKSWWPLQRTRDDKGNLKRAVNDKDTTLRQLKNEWGDEAHNAVVKALVDVHGCGSLDGQYEIWNFKEDRKAKIEEVTGWLGSGRKELPESGYLVFWMK